MYSRGGLTVSAIAALFLRAPALASIGILYVPLGVAVVTLSVTVDDHAPTVTR